MWQPLTSAEAWTAAAPTLLLIAGILFAGYKAFPHVRRLFRMIECQAAVPDQVAKLQTELDKVKGHTAELGENNGTSVRDRVIHIDDRTIRFERRLNTVERRLDHVEQQLPPPRG